MHKRWKCDKVDEKTKATTADKTATTPYILEQGDKIMTKHIQKMKT